MLARGEGGKARERLTARREADGEGRSFAGAQDDERAPVTGLGRRQLQVAPVTRGGDDATAETPAALSAADKQRSREIHRDRNARKSRVRICSRENSARESTAREILHCVQDDGKSTRKADGEERTGESAKRSGPKAALARSKQPAKARQRKQSEERSFNAFRMTAKARERLTARTEADGEERTGGSAKRSGAEGTAAEKQTAPDYADCEASARSGEKRKSAMQERCFAGAQHDGRQRESDEGRGGRWQRRAAPGARTAGARSALARKATLAELSEGFRGFSGGGRGRGGHADGGVDLVEGFARGALEREALIPKQCRYTPPSSV